MVCENNFLVLLQLAENRWARQCLSGTGWQAWTRWLVAVEHNRGYFIAFLAYLHQQHILNQITTSTGITVGLAGISTIETAVMEKQCSGAAIRA